MSRNAIGAAVLGLALGGGGIILAQPLPKGRPPEWAVAAGYGTHIKIGPGTTDFGVAVLTPSVGIRLSSRLEFVGSATFERYASPGGYFVGLLPAGARLSIGNGKVLPYLGLGVGFGWTDLDEKVPEISRRFNFRIESSFGVRIPAGDSSAWTVEGRYQHTSNAGTSLPNQGLNSIVGLVGWRFR
jgi:Lipid A 3-O-deacylase (PagL)